MRKVLLAIILLLGILLVLFSFSEIQDITNALMEGNLILVSVGLVVELIWLLNLGITFRHVYHLLGIREKSSHLFWVASAANFINVVAPSAGIGGIAIFLDDAKRRNHPTGRVTVVGALFVLYDYLAFLCFLALGWVVLIQRNQIKPGEITASIILLGLAIGLSVILYLGYKSNERLTSFLVEVTGIINRILNPFFHRPYLNEENAKRYARELSDGLHAIKGNPKDIIWPFLFSLNNKAILLLILAVCFLTFKIPFSMDTLVAGLSIGYLFLIVSPTPAGIGFVEGALTITLNALRVPLGSAVLVTLTYRAITFWFPLAVGGLALRILKVDQKIKKKNRDV
ncbi:YbhN family protein [Chloroflexota bacterium]